MSSEADTLPTIQTVLNELREFRSFVGQRFDRLENRMAAIEHQLEQMVIRLDRIESFSHQTRSEVLALRADLKEFRSQLNQPA